MSVSLLHMHTSGVSIAHQDCGKGRQQSIRPQVKNSCAVSRKTLPSVRRGVGCQAFFKNPFRETSEDAGIYGSQGRDDYSPDDVEHYFNYMGMLATEGTYERLYQLMSTGLEPVDLLLLMAAKENDAPKVAELLRAGAKLDVQDTEGRTPRQLAQSQAVLALLDNPASAQTF